MLCLCHTSPALSNSVSKPVPKLETEIEIEIEIRNTVLPPVLPCTNVLTHVHAGSLQVGCVVVVRMGLNWTLTLKVRTKTTYPPNRSVW